MQFAINGDKVRRFNAAAPALATAYVGKHFAVQVYRDFYGTANARFSRDGAVIDTQHNGYGWSKRRGYGSTVTPTIPTAKLREIDAAVDGLFDFLRLRAGAAIRSCRVCGETVPTGQSCQCQSNEE